MIAPEVRVGYRPRIDSVQEGILSSARLAVTSANANKCSEGTALRDQNGLSYACFSRGAGYSTEPAEQIHHRGPWKGMEDVEYATLCWVSWYNTQRLMEPLGYLPPRNTKNSFGRPNLRTWS